MTLHAWRPALGLDVTPCRHMAEQYWSDADPVWRIDPTWFELQLMRDVVTQFYRPLERLVMVRPGQALPEAYTWVTRGETTPWSSDEMAVVRMAHVDQTLPLRRRVILIGEMMRLWETWARAAGLPVICSTTMREDQAGFLALHRRAGYHVRGSIAYRRLDQG